jgi:DNA mismatch repair protein MutL
VATEVGHVVETVTKLALARPGLHLALRHNGKVVHEVPGEAGLLDRIGLFFGQDVRKAVVEVTGEKDKVVLTGYVADPACDRPSGKHQYLFVNGRWVRDRGLGHALQEAFRGLLMTGRYAVGFLFLRLPPDRVDVNAHPTKAEVRFRDPGLLHHLVQTAVKEALAKEDLLPPLRLPLPPVGTHRPAEPELPIPKDRFPWLDADPRPGWEPAAPAASPRAELARQTVAPWELAPVGTLPAPPAAGPAAAVPGPTPAHATAPAAAPVRAMQIHDAYLVVETPDGMLVVDQHALHERILYEQLRRRVRDGKLEAQRLLIPEPIDLTMEQAGAVLEARPQLAELGLDVEDFGRGTVAVSSYPALLGRVPVVQLFGGVVDVLTTRDRPPTRDQLLDSLLATMACQAAVKAGDRLAPEEVDYLMRLRPTAEDSHHCPHGRPTSLVFSRHELDKQFKRV